MAHTTRHSDPVAGTQDRGGAFHDDLELARHDSIDLVHAVCMFGKRCPRRIGVPRDVVPRGLEHPAERLLRHLSVS
jgi:hypothetical protein